MTGNNEVIDFSDPCIDLNPIYQVDNNQENDDCICGPKSCKSNAIIDVDEISLNIVEETEIVKVSLWESILRQSEDDIKPYKEWLKEKKNSEPLAIPEENEPAEFLEKNIFPLLLPAMKIMLVQARDWEALQIQKCRFNGLDFLAEILWNCNPRYPKRSQNWSDLFNIPPFKLFLRLNPRPIFPKSWLWSRDEGALMIQKWVRGWLVRKREDVQEMRIFWKAIIDEGKQEAIKLGITYSELLEKRRKERIEPCEQFWERR